MARSYGRARGGDRLVLPQPYARGNKFSIVGAVSIQKVVAAMYAEGSIDGVFFTHFIEHYLAPELKSGDQVIMDNVAFHKVKRVKEIIESQGASLIYLPPYSPDLSPIENMWSKLKSILRKFAARTVDTFQEAISEAFKLIKSSDLQGWFQHCGYKDQIF